VTGTVDSSGMVLISDGDGASLSSCIDWHERNTPGRPAASPYQRTALPGYGSNEHQACSRIWRPTPAPSP